MNRAFILSLIGFLIIVFPGFAQEGGGNFPRIKRLETADVVFRQYLADVEAARRQLFSRTGGGESVGTLTEALTIYRYIPSKGEDLFGLAARCNVPYAALATLNRLAHPTLPENGSLLLPSVPGIFIPETPASDLERLLLSARDQEEGIVITLNRGEGQEYFRFIPGADFTVTERAYFLDKGLFRFPLQSFRLTSAFGMRISPISGTPRFHEGLDLAAPAGTEVFAVRDGVVSELGEDRVYGNYIIIRHSDNWVSLYGHLSRINVRLNSVVQSGTIIGRVGSTGQSTGPHLHFELRQNGRAQDPGKYLFREGN